MEGARLADPSDGAAVELVAAAVSEELADQRGGALFLAARADDPPADRRLADACTADDALAVVGTFDEVVLGYALAQLVTLPDGRLLGTVTDLAVDPEAREVGIGEAMMNFLIDELTSRGCFGVDSTALPGDRETKNFFESFGLKARLLTVHRSLDDGGAAT